MAAATAKLDLSAWQWIPMGVRRTIQTLAPFNDAGMLVYSITAFSPCTVDFNCHCFCAVYVMAKRSLWHSIWGVWQQTCASLASMHAIELQTISRTLWHVFNNHLHFECHLCVTEVLLFLLLNSVRIVTKSVMSSMSTLVSCHNSLLV